MTRRETPLDASQILVELARYAVDYVLIGGLAVQAHGHVRTTQDADLFPAPDADNIRRLAAALSALGAGPLTADAFAASVLVLDTDAGGVDVHRQPPGAGRYADLRARALVVEVAGVSVAVAGLDDLIAMKRASGRPIDRGDVIALTDPD